MEALSAMPAAHPLRPKILEMLHRQMAALKTMQAPDGMWREVIDEPGSYRELTATAMIFSAMARGIRLGWIDRSYAPVAARAWRALAAHVGDDGSLVDVCESTGAGPTKEYYLNRKAISGLDDRGGAMALRAAVERYELQK
jgi:rhamnogalacturonyl hydrolase YesR